MWATEFQHPWGAYHCSNESGLEEILLSSDSHPTEAPYDPHLTVKTQSKTKYVKNESSLTKDPQSLDFISFLFIFFYHSSKCFKYLIKYF